MSMITALFALFLLGLATAQHPGLGKCPKPPVQPEFQLASYLGVWYEIARYDAIFELGSQCNTANYTVLPDAHIRVVNSGFKLESGKKVVSQAVGEAYIPNPLEGAKLEVKFSGNFTGKPNYWVVSTDYTQYTMVYSCEQFSPLFKFELAWILSRTPTISDSLKNELLAKYESLGISSKPFHYTKQGEAGECGDYNFSNPTKGKSEDTAERVAQSGNSASLPSFLRKKLRR